MRLFATVTALVVCCIATHPTHAVQSLTIHDASCEGLAEFSVSLTMDNDDPVQGFALAVAFDPLQLQTTGFNVEGTEAESIGAELVVSETYPSGGAILGVVLDAVSPFDGQTLPAGTETHVANLGLRAVMLVQSQTTVDVTFVDGFLGTPTVDNILVIDGASIGAPQGLDLNDGVVTCSPAIDRFSLEETCITSLETSPVSVLMTNVTGPVQGFVVAMTHDDSRLALVEVDLDTTATNAAGTEFFASDTSPDSISGQAGGTAAAILDFSAPFDGQTIAVGADQAIVRFHYTCTVDLVEGVDATEFATIEFIDGDLGVPPADNVIVVSGASVPIAELVPGAVCCEPHADEANTVHFYCGADTLEVDAAGDVVSGPLSGGPGETVDLCFLYTSTKNIQGFQLSVCFDCQLTLGDFSIAGTILEATGTEFLSFDTDHDSADGDGCELIVGILIDALPPFMDQTVPSTATPLVIGCVSATIAIDAACDSALGVEFCNGANGSGGVLIENIAVIDFQSIANVTKHDCEVLIVPLPSFERSDCNSDSIIDLADSSAILAIMLSGFTPSCEDACDSNDDGAINLADVVMILSYLFMAGETPPAPEPGFPGTDPTLDSLECESPNC